MTKAFGEMTIDEAMEHAGVKGMKWGVRREKRLNTIQRVGAGKGSKRDNLKVRTLEVSATSVNKNGGLAGAARSKARGMEQRKARIQSGQVRVTDILAQAGGDRLIDLGRA